MTAMANRKASTKAATGSADPRPLAIYARLSKAATGDLEKVEYQVEMCRRYAESRNLPVSDAHVYLDNSLSAWKKRVRRPEWDRLMDAVERGEVGGVLVYAVDRFTRRPKDLETLIELAEDYGLTIDGPRSGELNLTTATGRQQARWMALQAAAESDNTSERAKATLARKMREGQPMGTGRAFGFQRGGILQEPKEVAMIRDVATRMLAGEKLAVMAAELNKKGIRTTRGKEWNGAALARMLRGHRYGGHVEHHGKLVGTIPGDPILDPDTYDAVQAFLASRRRGRRPTGRFLLTGLLTCGKCGNRISGAPGQVALTAGTRPREYRCPPQLGGCGQAIRATETERIVGDHMVALLSDPTNAAKIMAKNQHLTEARAAQVAKLQAVKDRLTDLEVKWATGELIQEAYDRAKPILDKQLQALSDGLEDLRPEVLHVNYDAALDWSEMTDEEQRVVIRDYRVQVVIRPRTSTSRQFDPARVTFP